MTWTTILAYQCPSKYVGLKSEGVYAIDLARFSAFLPSEITQIVY